LRKWDCPRRKPESCFSAAPKLALTFLVPKLQLGHAQRSVAKLELGNQG